MSRDFRSEFRHLYDSLDRLHITLSSAFGGIQKQDDVRVQLAACTCDLQTILRNHAEAFVESFGPPALFPSAETRKLN